MTARSFMLGAALLMLGAPALAGTKFQANIVPTPPDCYSGPNFCKNGIGGCPGSTNAECTGTMSPASKVKIDGVTQTVKASVKNVVDQTGSRITTDSTNADDDFILKLTLCRCIADSGGFDICSNCNNVYLRFDLKNGNGKVAGDLSTAFATDPTGTPFRVTGGGITQMSAPAGCTGTNSAADIAVRLDDANCETGLFVGVIGYAKGQ